MDNDTREVFEDLLPALGALRDALTTQRQINDLVQSQLDSHAQRQDVFSAALRALAAGPSEVADSILKVVRDDADA